MAIIIDEKVSEVMDILQEECSEVIQAVSKIRRFGLDNSHPTSSQTNIQHLEEELGDVLAMVDLLQSLNMVTKYGLDNAKTAKIDKLKMWSKIFDNN